MKNVVKYTGLFLAVILLFTACSGSGSSSYSSSADSSMPAESYNDYESASGYGADDGADFSGEESIEQSSSDAKSPGEADNADDSDDTMGGAKLIRTVDIRVETKDFNGMVQAVRGKAAALGGYIESSDLSNYSEWRQENITIRIPYKKVDSFLDGLAEYGKVLSMTDNVEDITLQYADKQTHLENLKIQHKRLLELLENAKKLSDIIQLEDRLSQIETEIDSYNIQIRNYDNLVNYSSVRLSIQETEQISSKGETSPWARMRTGFVDNAKDVWSAVVEFVIWFVTHIPNLALLAVIISLIVFVVRKLRKRAEKKAKNQQWDNPYRYAGNPFMGKPGSRSHKERPQKADQSPQKEAGEEAKGKAQEKDKENR